MDSDTLETSGVLVAAWTIIDALNNAPEEAFETINTPMGRADVVLDEQGADVHLHDEGASVHVRPD